MSYAEAAGDGGRRGGIDGVGVGVGWGGGVVQDLEVVPIFACIK
jgi:hypothetical protein